MLKALNVGSGQKPYRSTTGIEWRNMDVNPRWEPDVVGDWADLRMFETESLDIVVAEQTVEHVGCGEAMPLFKEAYRVLKPGGVLVITMPDLKALAQRWMLGQIDDFIYSVNLYGAWMGHDADRHKWNTSYEGWVKFLMDAAPWSSVRRGAHTQAPVARDWWILEIGATK